VSDRYWELTVPAAPDSTEGLTNFLWELGALGVVEEDIAGTSRLRAFFGGALDADTLRWRVEAYVDGLVALGFAAPGPIDIGPLADNGWAEAWKAHFRPIAVGRRLTVAPPWSMPPSDGRLVIVIEPGRAFGTGHHGTTAGCLEAVEHIVERDAPATAIDIGTGSGILAIAAARLGVPRILAIDDDPDAVAAALANAARNRVCDRVRCRLGDAAALETPPAPLVIANLLSAAHRRLADHYARVVAPGGSLVLGGILDGEAAEVTTIVAQAGFRPENERSLEGWTTIELRRAPRPDEARRRAALHDHA
jgi:ribosomal protein L11 methyltransferase